MKKKLVSTVATLVLGAALIGGGTFAYFNDTEKINNKFAAGTLDLKVLQLEGSSTCPVNFDLRNMKPGDVVKRAFVLDAVGSLAIDDVMFDMTLNNFTTPVGDSTAEGFLDQFQIKVFKVQGIESIPDNVDIASSASATNLTNTTITLGDLLRAKSGTPIPGQGGATRLNLTPTGLSVNPEDKDGVYMEITFENKASSQNIYQGDVAELTWNLEATQEPGTSVGRCAENGNILQNSQLPGANGYDGIIFSNDDTYIDDKANNISPAVTVGNDVPNDQ